MMILILFLKRLKAVFKKEKMLVASLLSPFSIIFLNTFFSGSVKNWCGNDWSYLTLYQRTKFRPVQIESINFADNEINVTQKLKF